MSTTETASSPVGCRILLAKPKRSALVPISMNTKILPIPIDVDADTDITMKDVVGAMDSVNLGPPEKIDVSLTKDADNAIFKSNPATTKLSESGTSSATKSTSAAVPNPHKFGVSTPLGAFSSLLAAIESNKKPFLSRRIFGKSPVANSDNAVTTEVVKHLGDDLIVMTAKERRPRMVLAVEAGAAAPHVIISLKMAKARAPQYYEKKPDIGEVEIKEFDAAARRVQRDVQEKTRMEAAKALKDAALKRLENSRAKAMSQPTAVKEKLKKSPAGEYRDETSPMDVSMDDGESALRIIRRKPKPNPALRAPKKKNSTRTKVTPEVSSPAAVVNVKRQFQSQQMDTEEPIITQNLRTNHLSQNFSGQLDQPYKMQRKLSDPSHTPCDMKEEVLFSSFPSRLQNVVLVRQEILGHNKLTKAEAGNKLEQLQQALSAINF